jgi:hypothetical protein
LRGQPIDIVVPRAGIVANVPPHEVPRDAALDGQNVWVDIDGQLKARFGYDPLLQAGPNIGPINGVYWWTDIDLSNQYMAVSPTDVATIRGGTWAPITGFPPLTGSVDDPVEFIDYFQNNLINVVICNSHDPLKVWNTSQNVIAPLTPTVSLTGLNAYTGFTAPAFSSYPINTQFFVLPQSSNTGPITFNLNSLGPQPGKKLAGGVLTDLAPNDLRAGTIYNFSFDGTEFVLGFNLLAPVARDIASVAGRVIAVNILNGSVRNFTQVTWTTSFDFTVWPALAFYNFVDTDDPLVGVKAIGAQSAVICGTHSGWLAQALVGVTDPFAFQFSPIRGFVTGPVSPTAMVVAEGLLYFLGVDGRIWVTDGASAWTISQAIDPVIIADLNTSKESQVVAAYYPQYRQIWWIYPSVSQF